MGNLIMVVLNRWTMQSSLNCFLRENLPICYGLHSRLKGVWLEWTFSPKVNTDNTLKSTPVLHFPDQYNDRDGSRNDIGMFGGHNFIPDGRTTNKPIVLGLDVAPIAVPTGGTVTIESTGATAK